MTVPEPQPPAAQSTPEPQPPAAQSTPARDGALLERTVFEVKRVIVGQDRLVERMLVGLLSRGHLLIEGVPGVAKTLAVETFARVVGGSFARLQFTPDLVPSDILGTRIYRQGREEFDVELGPVVANFVLTDEINRAPAKVQSALLEVMAERHVSIGGRTFPMPEPFLVLATQNPIENEGVYPLPEAQRDRFLFKIVVDYPTGEEEREIVYRMGVTPPLPRQVLSPAELVRLQGVAARVFVHHALVDYVVRLVLATRTAAEHGLTDVAGWVAYGASPRASLGIVAAARALALVRGRDYVLPQDVVDVAPDVLRHRLVLSYDAMADGVPVDHVITRVLQTVPLPQVSARPVPATTGANGRVEVALRALELSVRQRLDGLLQGNHLGLVPGPGTDAGEARIYQPGDDVRRMDWAVTARTTEPHIRETVADRELETWVVVDLSPSLDFGTAACEKRDLAVAAVAAVAHLTRGGGNRIGAVVATGERTVRIPARSGLAYVRALIRQVALTRPAPEGTRGDLAAALEKLRRPPRRRGLAVVVSDFIGPLDWERVLRGLSARHDLLAVEVLDPRDLELPEVGTVVLADPESGRQREVVTTPVLCREFAAAAAAHREQVAAALRRCGAAHLVLRTDSDWIADVVRFVVTRKRHLSGGGR